MPPTPPPCPASRSDSPPPPQAPSSPRPASHSDSLQPLVPPTSPRHLSNLPAELAPAPRSRSTRPDPAAAQPAVSLHLALSALEPAARPSPRNGSRLEQPVPSSPRPRRQHFAQDGVPGSANDGPAAITVDVDAASATRAHGAAQVTMDVGYYAGQGVTSDRPSGPAPRICPWCYSEEQSISTDSSPVESFYDSSSDSDFEDLDPVGAYGHREAGYDSSSTNSRDSLDDDDDDDLSSPSQEPDATDTLESDEIVYQPDYPDGDIGTTGPRFPSPLVDRCYVVAPIVNGTDSDIDWNDALFLVNIDQDRLQGNVRAARAAVETGDAGNLPFYLRVGNQFYSPRGTFEATPDVPSGSRDDLPLIDNYDDSGDEDAVDGEDEDESIDFTFSTDDHSSIGPIGDFDYGAPYVQEHNPPSYEQESNVYGATDEDTTDEIAQGTGGAGQSHGGQNGCAESARDQDIEPGQLSRDLLFSRARAGAEEQRDHDHFYSQTVETDYNLCISIVERSPGCSLSRLASIRTLIPSDPLAIACFVLGALGDKVLEQILHLLSDAFTREHQLAIVKTGLADLVFQVAARHSWSRMEEEIYNALASILTPFVMLGVSDDLNSARKNVEVLENSLKALEEKQVQLQTTATQQDLGLVQPNPSETVQPVSENRSVSTRNSLTNVRTPHSSPIAENPTRSGATYSRTAGTSATSTKSPPQSSSTCNSAIRSSPTLSSPTQSSPPRIGSPRQTSFTITGTVSQNDRDVSSEDGHRRSRARRVMQRFRRSFACFRS